ncbi:MAG: UDP-N-acetylmuramate dehydrogenase [Victivallaceae bacterium]
MNHTLSSIIHKFPLPTLNNVPLKRFSTFGIGGPARHLSILSSRKDTRLALSFVHRYNIPFLILGHGSNCLFSDKGFEGIILLNKLKTISYDSQKHLLTVESGYPFTALSKYCESKNLNNLEFAYGIPGTVGGAIFMNAGTGAYNVASVLVSATFLDKSGKEITLSKDELLFDYRKSFFQKHRNYFILSGVFSVAPVVETTCQSTAPVSLNKQRFLTQPYREKSLGCIFRNPSGSKSAGQLIDECGCKGLTKGDAYVSSLHANFIINKGQARTEDVLDLIQYIKTIVLEKTGTMLEEEVMIISSTDPNVET